MDTLAPLSKKQKRGPAPTGKGTLIGVRLQPSDLSGLDAWIAAQAEPQPSRPEAIRRILADALAGGGTTSIAVEDLNASNDE